MGCTSSQIQQICGITFEYTQSPIHSQLDEEHTFKYMDVEVTIPMYFTRFTIENQYPRLLHFKDTETILLCRDGAAILVVQRQDQSINATATWMLIEEYAWILPRLQRMTHDPIINTVIVAASKLESLSSIQKSLNNFKQRAMIVEEDHRTNEQQQKSTKTNSTIQTKDIHLKYKK